jgi:hypothetical protein
MSMAPPLASLRLAPRRGRVDHAPGDRSTLFGLNAPGPSSQDILGRSSRGPIVPRSIRRCVRAFGAAVAGLGAVGRVCNDQNPERTDAGTDSGVVEDPGLQNSDIRTLGLTLELQPEAPSATPQKGRRRRRPRCRDSRPAPAPPALQSPHRPTGWMRGLSGHDGAVFG